MTTVCFESSWEKSFAVDLPSLTLTHGGRCGNSGICAGQEARGRKDRDALVWRALGVRTSEVNENITKLEIEINKKRTNNLGIFRMKLLHLSQE